VWNYEWATAMLFGKLARNLREIDQEQEFHLHSNLKDYYGYSRIELRRVVEGSQVSLIIKIAEIRGEPFVFAGIWESESRTLQFPFFGDISDDDTADFLLHYIADFVLSGRPDESGEKGGA
jgi:hypothetical protein